MYMCDDTAGVHTRKSIQFDDTYIEVRRMLVMLEFKTKQSVLYEFAYVLVDCGATDFFCETFILLDMYTICSF